MTISEHELDDQAIADMHSICTMITESTKHGLACEVVMTYGQLMKKNEGNENYQIQHACFAALSTWDI